MALIYHPDKNPENTIESGEKMKQLNAAKDYLDEIDFDNYNKNNSTFYGRIIMQFASNGISTRYEPNEVCASFIDKNNFIYIGSNLKKHFHLLNIFFFNQNQISFETFHATISFYV